MGFRLPLPGLTLPAALLGPALAGCVGGALAASYSETSPAPAPDAFACIRDQLKAVGFTQSSLDTDELRVTAKKYDETARRPDVQFRRIVDRLSFDVDPGSGGAITHISGEAATFGEFTTQRGPTEVQEKTSDVARKAADTIVRKCSAPVDSTQAPG
jgi:hypothetical protein